MKKLAKIVILSSLFSIANSIVYGFESSGPGYDACNNPARTTELVADPTDCHFFYSCIDSGKKSFIAYRMACPELTGFDLKMQRCEWESTVDSCSAITIEDYPDSTEETETDDNL